MAHRIQLQRERSNFSRHIEGHEKRGEKVDHDIAIKLLEKNIKRPESRSAARQGASRIVITIERCKKILEDLKKDKYSVPFRKRKEASGLQSVDFEGISVKLMRSTYTTHQEFHYDILRVLATARKLPQLDVQHSARKLHEKFIVLWEVAIIDSSFKVKEDNLKRKFPNILVPMWKCKAILERIREHEKASPFRVPVDVERDKIPDYYTVIKNPMDLQTLETKMALSQLKTYLDFTKLMLLIFKNAQIYNGLNSPIYYTAELLSRTFIDLLVDALRNMQDMGKKMSDGMPACTIKDGKAYFWDPEQKQYYYEYFERSGQQTNPLKRSRKSTQTTPSNTRRKTANYHPPVQEVLTERRAKKEALGFLRKVDTQVEPGHTEQEYIEPDETETMLLAPDQEYQPIVPGGIHGRAPGRVVAQTPSPFKQSNVPGQLVARTPFGNRGVGQLVPKTPTSFPNRAPGQQVYRQYPTTTKLPGTTVAATPAASAVSISATPKLRLINKTATPTQQPSFVLKVKTPGSLPATQETDEMEVDIMN